MYNNTSYEEYMRTVLGYTPKCIQDTFMTNDYYIMQNNNNCIADDLYPDMYKKVYPLVCKECNTNTMPITREILEQMTDNVLNQIEIDLKIQTNLKIETREGLRNSDSKVEDINHRTKETNLKLQDMNSRNQDVSYRNQEASRNRQERVQGITSNQKESIRTQSINLNKKDNTRAQATNLNVEDTRGEDRNIRNNTLRDLIKILILRELIDNGNFPSRPPQIPIRPPILGPRPPFSGGTRPPFPGGSRKFYAKRFLKKFQKIYNMEEILKITNFNSTYFFKKSTK